MNAFAVVLCCLAANAYAGEDGFYSASPVRNLRIVDAPSQCQYAEGLKADELRPNSKLSSDCYVDGGYVQICGFYTVVINHGNQKERWTNYPDKCGRFIEVVK